MKPGAALLLAVVTVGACAAPRTTPASSGAPTPTVAAATATVSPLAIRVTDARYGALALTTAAGAQCTAEVHVTPGDNGEPPLSALGALKANVNGVVAWTYPTPRVPHSAASYWVTCTLGGSAVTETATFDPVAAPMVATDLAVHVSTATPERPSYTPDPSLNTLRDAVTDRIGTTLADEWNKATRGLGHIRIVEDSPDITIYVVAAAGTSVNRKSGRDGSEDIVIFVSDTQFGKITVENGVATALHELGHIWCCYGPDADSGGHWKVKLRDPGLYGVDKYGLMTDPVLCITFGAILSCPNRFSDREMRALGFDTFPPPAPDPCVTQSLSLKTQIDAGKSRLAGLNEQIKSIEAQYPYGIPPSVYPAYQSLIAQYNVLAAQVSRQVDLYNALPCDAS